MSTSKNWATAALVSCALLLSGCAALEDMAGDFSAPSEETTQASPPPAAEALVSSGEYNLVESCNAFFTGPLAASVQQTTQAVQAPLNEELTGTASTISKGIGLLIGKADPVSVAHLEAIRAPFDQALDGSIARPTAVVVAVDEYKSTCAEAGFKG